MTPLQTAAAAALSAVAAEDERLVCVTAGRAGDADPAAAVVAAALPGFGDRVLAVPGASARPWVAAGLAETGRRPVLLLEPGAPVPSAAIPGALVVTADQVVADALLGAGFTVLHPAWPDDVAPLLQAAIAAREPVVLRLHDSATSGPLDPVDPPVLGRPRILRSGGEVTLAGSGPTAGLLADVARMLAGRGARVTAVDQHTLRPGRGVSLALFDGALVVGSGDGGVPGRVRRVAVAGEPRQVMEAVFAAVPSLQPARAAGVREA
ncbi:MAG TPA: hypothetical protein VIK95_12910 [Egibacteraceae bacterium]